MCTLPFQPPPSSNSPIHYSFCPLPLPGVLWVSPFSSPTSTSSFATPPPPPTHNPPSPLPYPSSDVMTTAMIGCHGNGAASTVMGSIPCRQGGGGGGREGGVCLGVEVGKGDPVWWWAALQAGCGGAGGGGGAELWWWCVVMEALCRAATSPCIHHIVHIRCIYHREHEANTGKCT